MKVVNKTFKKVVAIGASLALAATVTVSTVPATAFAVTQSEIDAAAAQVNTLTDQLDLLVDQYNVAMNSYSDATEKYEQAQAQIEQKQAEQKVSQKRLGSRAVSMYKNGSAGLFEFVLGSASFTDMSSRVSMLNSMNENDANLISEVKQQKEALEQAKDEYATEKANASAALAEAAAQKADVESQQASYQSQLNNLKAKYGAQLESAREANYAKTSGGSSSGGGGSVDPGPACSDAVGRAYACLGKPYVYGAAGPDAYDCSGLVSYCLTGCHSHRYVSGDFWSMPAVSNPQPGDVCACSEGHCGIYIGNNQMIHAPHTGAVVCVTAARGKIVRVG